MEISPAMDAGMGEGTPVMTLTHGQPPGCVGQAVGGGHLQLSSNQMPLMVSTSMPPSQHYVTYTGATQVQMMTMTTTRMINNDNFDDDDDDDDDDGDW
jgi:hypothetical protein